MAEFCYREHHFPNAVSMANYILECDKANKAKAEFERQEKLKAEQKARAEEVEKAYTEYVDICNKAREKYLAIRSKYDKDYNNGYYFGTWD